MIDVWEIALTFLFIACILVMAVLVLERNG